MSLADVDLLLKRAEEYRAAHAAVVECQATLASAWTTMMVGMAVGDLRLVVEVKALMEAEHAAQSVRACAETALREAALGAQSPCDCTQY